MTLVSLITKWKNNEINDKTFIKNYHKLNIYNPILDDEEPIFFNGDGNSWLEVKTQLEDNNIISYDDKEYLINLLN